jgi:hypothetical protein
VETLGWLALIAPRLRRIALSANGAETVIERQGGKLVSTGDGSLNPLVKSIA